MPTPDGSFISITADVVDADVPLLLGIEKLERERIVADNELNILDSRRLGWHLPITRRDVHMFVGWDTKLLLLTRAELRTLHYHFFHPSACKLYNSLNRVGPSNTTPDTLSILEEISKVCHTCAKFSPGPHRFRVSLPSGNFVFNHTLALDLFLLDVSPVLNVVDVDTHFSSAIFLRGKSTSDV